MQVKAKHSVYQVDSLVFTKAADIPVVVAVKANSRSYVTMNLDQWVRSMRMALTLSRSNMEATQRMTSYISDGDTICLHFSCGKTAIVTLMRCLMVLAAEARILRIVGRLDYRIEPTAVVRAVQSWMGHYALPKKLVVFRRKVCHASSGRRNPPTILDVPANMAIGLATKRVRNKLAKKLSDTPNYKSRFARMS